MEKETETGKNGARRNAGGLFASGGIAAGLAALAGGTCCVLPVMLVQAGASAAIASRLGVLSQARPVLLVLAAALVGAGFVAAFRNGRKPHPRLLVLLGAAALVIAAAIAAPLYEQELLEWVRSR